MFIYRSILIQFCTVQFDYWFLNFGRDYHCGLIGYQVKKKPQTLLQGASHGGNKVPVALTQHSAASANVNIASTKGIYCMTIS